MVVADMVCGRYRFSTWPIWIMAVADIVLLWPIWLYPLMGRIGLVPVFRFSV